MVGHPVHRRLNRYVNVARNEPVAALCDIRERGFRHATAFLGGAVGDVFLDLRHQLGDLFGVAGLRRLGHDLRDRHLGCLKQRLLQFRIGVGRAVFFKPRLDLFDGGIVETRQNRISQQLVHDLLAPFGIAQDLVVIDLVSVLQRPVVGVILVFLVVHIAAELADRIAVDRFDRIVVHLRPLIAHGAPDRPPAAKLEVILHRLTRPVEPFHSVGKAGFQMLVLDRRAMDSDFPFVRVKLEQRLDAPALVPRWRCRIEVLFGHRIAGPVDHIARAEDAPGDHDPIGIPCRVQHRVQRAVAIVDAEKFIGIEHQDPVGLGDFGFGLRVFHRRWLRLHPFGDVVAPVVAQTQLFKPDQHVIGAVGTIIRVNEYLGEPHGKVMGVPLQQEWCLVLHHRDGQQLAVPAGVRFQIDGKGPS